MCQTINSMLKYTERLTQVATSDSSHSTIYGDVLHPYTAALFSVLRGLSLFLGTLDARAGSEKGRQENDSLKRLLRFFFPSVPRYVRDFFFFFFFVRKYICCCLFYLYRRCLLEVGFIPDQEDTNLGTTTKEGTSRDVLVASFLCSDAVANVVASEFGSQPDNDQHPKNHLMMKSRALAVELSLLHMASLTIENHVVLQQGYSRGSIPVLRVCIKSSFYKHICPRPAAFPAPFCPQNQTITHSFIHPTTHPLALGLGDDWMMVRFFFNSSNHAVCLPFATTNKKDTYGRLVSQWHHAEEEQERKVREEQVRVELS